MNKILSLAVVAALTLPLFAADANDTIDAKPPAGITDEKPRQFATWPAFIALCEWPNAIDVVGIRFTIPFSTVQESVSGVDLGFWGRARYFEGFQLNILRNDVKDQLSGFQVGCYNSVERGDLFGIQVGLWNEANTMSGIQLGLINVAGSMDGFQVGLINRAEAHYGFQVGLINIIRSANIPMLPICNIGF